VLQSGTTVAGYRVDGVLGEGGMAIVYRATQLSLNRIVALKLLASELSDDPSFKERFRREGQLQAAIDHLHIVPVYEAGQSEHGLFLAMRLITGPTLKDVILDNRLEPRRTLRLLAQVAQALDAAHGAGLIHRDIKPQNILVGDGDHVYLADFGLTKAPDEASITGTGQFMGTIDYVAPEQIRGETATGATDCYSLTAVLFECLTGQVPFSRNNEVATLHAQLTEPPPKVTDLRPDLPEALNEVIASGMSKDPTKRPVSTSELIRAASRAFSSGTPLAPPGGQQTRLAPSPGDGSEISQLTRGYGTPVPPAAPTPPSAAPANPTAPSPAAATASAAAAPTAQSPAAATEASATAPSAAPPAQDPTTVSRGAEATGAEAAGARAAAEAPTHPGAATAPEHRRKGVSSGAMGLLAVLAVAAIAVGFLVGHSGSKSGASSYPNFASVGPVSLHYPAGWRLSSAVPSIPGLTFSQPLNLADKDSSAGVNAGVLTGAGGPTLLPSALRAAVSGGLPSPEPVSLGSLHAYHYSDLAVKGAPGSLTLYAVPTSSGVATVACYATTHAAAEFANQCARIAATLRLTGATAYPLGPDTTTARLFSSTFAQLRNAVTKGESQLQSAKTPAAQATAGQQLAQAYAKAASQLRQGAASPLAADARASLASALQTISTGYAHAATAAKANNGGAYRRAVAQISAGGAALTAALKSLDALGYRVSA
jgi:serine/threonine protein kinase